MHVCYISIISNRISPTMLEVELLVEVNVELLKCFEDFRSEFVSRLCDGEIPCTRTLGLLLGDELVRVVLEFGKIIGTSKEDPELYMLDARFIELL
mmetsp:Transcript_9171/g.22528  ORF Transcript_9171/g.22528 Transcript_9171/m.22528 type:complete len:96 (+) Transcript_9171:182-469(+)